MSPARIIRIARLVPFDELNRRNLSELLRLPSFLMLVKQCEGPSADTLLPILQSKFGSAESEPFAGERGGSVVECRTPEREVGGSKPTAAVLCP